MFGDNFLKASDVEEHGEIVKILQDGELYTFEKNNRTVMKFPVEFVSDGTKKVWTTNNTSLKRLAKAWGEDTKDWTFPCYAKMKIAAMMVQGDLKDVVFGYPTTDPNPQKKN